MPTLDPTPRPPRRAVPVDERGRDTDRTRERIIAAAVAEFGAHGYAGARTARIAARAGLNQQLIAYHFGGKQGLLEELRARWAGTEEAAEVAGTSFAESIRAYFDATLDHPDWARLMIWRALGDGPADETAADSTNTTGAKLADAVERIRRRQRDGEVTGALDAEFILLLAYLLAFAPIALPDTVEGIYGIVPLSPDYRRRALDQLLLVVKPDPEGTPE